MDIKQAMIILDEFQEWRIGNTDNLSYTPREISQAIDRVLIFVSLCLEEEKDEN